MTNLVELYNMIMCGVRIPPLVDIVEFILYGFTYYFIKHHGVASLALLNSILVYGTRIIEYMENKTTKSIKHNVKSTCVIDLRLEASCKAY
jgi:hypothetical protein